MREEGSPHGAFISSGYFRRGVCESLSERKGMMLLMTPLSSFVPPPTLCFISLLRLCQSKISMLLYNVDLGMRGLHLMFLIW